MTSSSAAVAAPSPSPKTFPLIPLTKEFMSMLGTSDEKAIYALKPVFATRCERISSTNKLLERAVLFSQDGTLRLIDTSNGRITHTLELGEKRNMEWSVSVVADREKDPKTHTHGVRIVIDKSSTRAAFESTDEKDTTEELVLQFHCARAPVAVNFVAMLRHFVAINGVTKKFHMSLQTESVVNETVSSRGSLDVISNKFAAARKSSFMNKSPERSQSFADEARRHRKDSERRGEDIQVLAPAVVPTVREQQKQEKEEAARKKREKEEAERRAAEEAAAADAAERKAADDAVAAEEAEKQAVRKREILAALAASRHQPADATLHAASATTIAPSQVDAEHAEPGAEASSAPRDGAYDSDEDLAPTAASPGLDPPSSPPINHSGVAAISMDDDAYGATTVVAATAPSSQHAEQGSLVALAPQGQHSGGAAVHVDGPTIGRNPDAVAAAAVALTTENDASRANMRSILSKLRQGNSPQAPTSDHLDDNDVDEGDEEMSDGEDPPPMDEDSFIDSLSPKEAQEVVSGIMNSIEDLKEEQEQLMLQREALLKSLRELSSVTLGGEHALALAGIVWNICDLKLLRHFAR